jgi:hypothetical protein
MSLHIDEVAQLEMREKVKRSQRTQDCDTGWQIDENRFTKGKDIGKYWIADGKIWGSKSTRGYQVAKDGRIMHNNQQTEFYIRGKRVYGPCDKLPWME